MLLWVSVQKYFTDIKVSYVLQIQKYLTNFAIMYILILQIQMYLLDTLCLVYIIRVCTKLNSSTRCISVAGNQVEGRDLT